MLPCIFFVKVVTCILYWFFVHTVDQKIFTLKIIRVKNFRVVKFLWFRSIREIFLMVDYCNMDEHLESSWRLVYYQVSGEPGIARCICQSDIYLRECGLARKLIYLTYYLVYFCCSTINYFIIWFIYICNTFAYTKEVQVYSCLQSLIWG